VKQIVGAASKPDPKKGNASMSKRAWSIVVSIVAPIVALGAAGCVIETHHDGGGGSVGGDAATITARWSLRNALDGASTACPTGFDTVEVITQPVDNAGAPTGETTSDLFECNGRTGDVAGLLPDVYQVWIEVRSHDLSTLYAQSLSQIIDVRQVDQVFSTDILNDGGYFLLSWDLFGKTTNRPLDCAQAGVTTIHLRSTFANAQRAYDDQLVCEDRTAVTGGLLKGSYTIAINALAGDMSVGSTTMLTNKTISGQNAVTDLGLIAIPIDGR
jgi:hypothetical protein